MLIEGSGCVVVSGVKILRCRTLGFGRNENTCMVTSDQHKKPISGQSDVSWGALVRLYSNHVWPKVTRTDRCSHK